VLKMRIQILEPRVRNNLRHRRRPQLNEETFRPLDLLPCAQDIGVLLQGRQNRFVQRKPSCRNCICVDCPFSPIRLRSEKNNYTQHDAVKAIHLDVLLEKVFRQEKREFRKSAELG
jgi:hypothetical protein